MTGVASGQPVVRAWDRPLSYLSDTKSPSVTQNAQFTAGGVGPVAARPGPRQQHTLFLASEARQPLVHQLPTGPSFKPDAWGSREQSSVPTIPV